MDAARFDAWTRRRFGIASGGALAAVVSLISSDAARAGNGKNKPKKNKFGCVDVGDKCRGKDSLCCSGICKGKKPKRGKPDKSRCVGHHASTCQKGQDSCAGADIACTNSRSETARCVITTGKASYCAGDVFCQPCARDADCPEEQFESGAACIVCDECLTGNTACATLRTFF
jgi:hypothetical protein